MINSKIKVRKGTVTPQRLENTALYVDITVVYDGKAYNLLRTFADDSVEIFCVSKSLKVPMTKLYVIGITDDKDKFFTLDREEVEQVLEKKLLGKTVKFTSYDRMVISEVFHINGTIQIRGKVPYALPSAKIEYPKVVTKKPVSAPLTMNIEEEDLSFDIVLNRDKIPTGRLCEDCTFYHYLYFKDPNNSTQRIKIPYCLFLRQGSLPIGIPQSEIDVLTETLGQTSDELTDSDTGIFGLDMMWDGIKACNVNI